MKLRALRPKEYFLICLLFPTVFPLLLLGIGRIVTPFSRYVGGGMEYVGIWLGIFGIFVALPYIVFSSLIYFWLRKKEAKKIRNIIWIMPLIFVPFMALIGKMGLTLAFPAIFMGYGYVLMVQIGYGLGGVTGIIKN